MKKSLGILLLGATLLPAVASAVEPRIFVIGVWPNRVRFFDETTEEFVGEMALRYGAITSVFGSDRTADSRKFFFVTDRMEAVEIVDIAARAVVDEVKLSSPERKVRIYGAAPDPAARMLYLTVEAVGMEVDRFVSEVVDIVQYDLESRAVVRSFPLPAEIPAPFLPPLVRVAPDGKSLYVISGDIFVMDVESQKITDRVELSKPRSSGYGPASFLLFPVQSESDPSIFYGIYRSPDPVLGKPMLGVTRVDMNRREYDQFEVGRDVNVEWFALAPDGARAYAGMGDLVSMDLEAKKVILRKERAEQGRQNVGMVVSFDGTKLFVGGVGPQIDVYDTTTLERLRRVHAGGDVMNPPQPIPRSAFDR